MYYNSDPSIWKISELLTWSDLNFIDNSEKTDVENYCSFIGAYDICTMFRGIIPIVHGPVGCISSHYSNRIATRLKEKIRPLPFSTCMNENDVIFGATDKLGKAIKGTDQIFKPKLIVILTTCVSDMIAEDINSLIFTIKNDVNADLLVMNVGGISCQGFREGANYAFKMLMDYVKAKKTQPVPKAKTINLFFRRIHGKMSDDKDIDEITKMLDINGIKINTIIRIGTSYDELLQIPQAQANISLCYTYGKETMQHLEKLFQQSYASTSYPIGISGMKQWVKNITEILGLQDEFSKSNDFQEAELELDKLKLFLAEKMKIKQMFIWHSGEKALSFIKLAYDLGLEPVLIGFTYHLIKVTRETIIELLNKGYDPTVVIRGHSKLWSEYETEYDYYERPLLFMPKKFWLGNLPTVDIDLFRDHAVGLSGFKNIAQNIYECYTKDPIQNFSVFDRYVEKKYEKVDWK